MTNDELIKLAEKAINPHTTEDGRLHGDVGAALISEDGRVYVGTCIDTPSWGICAERTAIAAMITAGEYRITKIVGVWRDQKSNLLYVLPPCGICRQFMKQIDQGNLDTEIVLGADTTRKLSELLPFHEWPPPLSGTP
jgi:cytidine deaminase